MGMQGKKKRGQRTARQPRWIGLESLESRALLTSAAVILPGSLDVTPGSLLEGTTLATLSGTFNDADIGEIHTGSINWGDGNITPATIGTGGGLGTVTVRFDYSLDANNFFDTQAKKDLLQSIADGIVSHFGDSLLAITPGGSNTWTQVFPNPATGATANIVDPTVLANEIVIYAGGRDLPGSTLGFGGPGGFSGSGSQAFLDNLSQRGQGTTQGAGATEFAPWGGAITFDTASTWWFGAGGDTSGLAGKNDFFSVATHELMHAFGFGTSDSWAHFRASGNTVFTGAQSVALFGSNVPLSGDTAHWAEGTMSDGNETVMDPTITVGTRKTMTALDFAALDDIGWDYIANPGTGTISGTHTYADSGNYTISVTVSDTFHTSTAATKNVTVTNVAPTLTISTGGPVNEGATLNLTVNHSDPGTDTITSWSINWGDGNIEVFPGASPTPSHVYVNPGNFTISATATDEDGTFSSNSISQTISNVAPTLTTISDLGTALDNIDFSIPYATLFAASNAADAGGGAISFRVESVNSGTLTKNGFAITPGVTTISVGETLVWHSAPGSNSLINAFSVKAFDGTAASATAIAVNIATISSNHAPTLPVFTTPFALPTTNEDTTSTGTLVSAILTAQNANDIDPDAASGIAITAATGLGIWQYSSNGVSWTNFPAVSGAASLLLSSTMQVRYAPNTFNGETPTFTFRAWDQTSGTSGSTANTTTTGGVTAFSNNTSQASIVVSAVNDAPTLTISPAISLTGTNEETASPGTLVSALLTAVSASDVDTGATAGIAITNTVGAGNWQYSTDGLTWTNIGAVASTSALLLTSTSQVRYLPDSRNGESPTFTFRVWDQTSGTASINGFPSKASTNPSGNSTAFSIATGQGSLTVTGVNDAPMLPPISPAFEVLPTNEDTASTGTLISSILAGVTVADIDNGAVAGIAITATSGNGVWQYTVDGITWTTIISVSSSSSLLLSSTSLIRYFPDLLRGETATLTFRAWDLTSGTASGTNSPSKVDTQINGGATAFSIDQAQASILVTDVNDAPTLPGAGAPFALSPTDEGTTSTGVLISSVISATLSDVDPSPLGGAAIVATTGLGAWQYSTDGNSWTAFGVISDSQSLLLSPATFVRYIPDGRNGETATFTYRAWDQTSDIASTNNSPSRAPTLVRGGTTAFSVNTAQAAIVVVDVNDAPVIPASPPAITLNTTNEDTPSTGTLVSAIYTSATATDIDNGSPSGIAVTQITGRGLWQYSTNGISWTSFSAVSTSAALLLAGTTQIRYSPDSVAGETVSLTFVAWDQSAGTPSAFNAPTVADTTIAGGESAFSINSASASLNVTDVNDAPTLTAPLFSLPGSDAITPTAAVTVASILGANVADVDAGAVAGIAVESQSALGSWQFSINGFTWTNFGAVSSAAALLLSPTSFVRFNPNGTNTETPTFTYRAWDQTSGTASSDGIRSTRNTAGAGGSSAISEGIATVSAVISSANHAPTFTPGPNVTVNEDAGAVSVAWASAISAGPLSEAGQALTFIVLSNDNPALFSVGPSVSANGQLTFTPAPNANGSAVISLQLKDSGGTADGGVDTSAAATFTLHVTSINDAPTLSAIDLPVIPKNAGAQTVNGFVSADVGPDNESDQSIIQYIVSDLTNAALFAAPPLVDADGNLTYTPANNAFGTATFTLRGRDSGGTANSGNDTSAPITVTIRVAQTFTKTQKIPAIADLDGTLVTFTLGGNGTAQLLRGVDGSFSLDLTGTDAKSTLTVTTKKTTQPGDDGIARLSNINIAGALGSFTAKTSDLVGNFSATGSVSAFAIRNISGQTISIGASADPKIALAFTAGRVSDTAIASGLPIKSLTAFEWLDSAAPETIAAPRIDALKITGDKKTPGVTGRFEANLQLTGSADPLKLTLGTTTITGAVDGGWNVTGKAGKISAASFDSGWLAVFSNTVAGITASTGSLSGSIDALSIAAISVKTNLDGASLRVRQAVSGKLLGINTLTVTGSILNSTLLADGSLGAITAGAISGSRIFAAFGNADSTLPANVAELGSLDAPATIASLMIKGGTGAAASNPSFTNSFIAAATISKISLKIVDGSAPATFGIAAHTLGTFTRTGGTPLPKPHTAPATYDSLGNFVLKVL